MYKYIRSNYTYGAYMNIFDIIILTITIILEMSVYHVMVFILLLEFHNIDIWAEYFNIGNFASIP